jgi:phage-related minor tail protein
VAQERIAVVVGAEDDGSGASTFNKIGDSAKDADRQVTTANDGMAKSSTDAAKKISDAEIEIKTAQVGLQKTTLDLTRAQDRLAKVQADSGASASTLQRAALDVTKAELRQVKATRDLDSAQDQAQTSTVDLAQSLDKTEEASHGAEGGLGGLVDQLKELPAVAALAGVAAGAGLGEAITSGLDVGGAQAKFRAQLGVTKTDAAAIGKEAADLYKNNFGDSLEDVQDALVKVRQASAQLRVSGSADITEITGDALNLASTFGEEVGPLVEAASRLISNGLVPNARSAFDVITTGFQQGDNQSEDFLDTLTEYPVQFAKLGISGPQALGLISQGLKAGARDTDIIADAFKEFSIRAIDGSDLTATAFGELGLDAEVMGQRIAGGGKTANDALNLTLQRLREIPDPVLRSQAAVGLFGTQAEDLGAALFALDPAAASATSNLKTVGGAAARMGEALGDSDQAKITTFLRGLETGATQAGAAAIRAAEPVGRLASRFGELPEPAKAASFGVLGVVAAGKALTAGGPALTAKVDSIATSLKNMSPASIAGGAALAGFGAAVGLLVQKLEDGKQKAKDFVQTLLDTAGATDAQSSMEALAKALGNTDEATKLTNEQTFQAVVQFKKLQQQVADTAQSQALLGTATSGATYSTDLLTTAAQGAAGGVKDERTEMQKLNDELDRGLNPREDQIRAAIAFKEALAGLTEAHKDNGSSLSDNTAKGRANRTALLNAVDAAKALAQADAGMGQSLDHSNGVLDASIRRLRSAATAAGLNKGEVDKLIKSIYAVPAHKDAKVTLDISAAQAAATRIQRAINGVRGKDVSVHVSQTGQLQRITHDLARIAGYGTIPVNIKVNGRVLGLSKGGEIHGGTPGQDSVPALLMPGERVLTRSENRAYKLGLRVPGASSGGWGSTVTVAPGAVQITTGSVTRETLPEVQRAVAEGFARLRAELAAGGRR